MAQTEKILVVGGTGLVGNALVRAWLRRGRPVAGATFHRQESAFFHRLDMRDPAAVRKVLAEVSPTLVAVPAANPYVDYCEAHPEETRALNVEGTLNVAGAAKEIGARVVFFSSDYVFDGKKGSYKEEDAPNPLNEYGRQKAQTEAAILALDPRNLVVRTSGAYGWQSEPKNFVLQVRARLRAREPLTVTGVRYNPTNSDNLADVVVRLCEAGKSGIYHVVGGERIVRREFARLVARALGEDEGLIRAGEPPPGAAPRPAESSLDTSKVRREAGVELWGAKKGLEEMFAGEESWRREWRNLISS